MKENLYVIATKVKDNQEIYLAVDETKNNGAMIWTRNIKESYADFDYKEIKKFAERYFKNFKKWYIKRWVATFY